jgi:hypothetical protein
MPEIRLYSEGLDDRTGREIRDVRRCSLCQAVVQALVHDVYISDENEQAEAIFWLPRRRHTAQDCSQQLTLNQEQWPTLW